jgi:hypothetical protein
MRIISKFKDYYDAATSAGVDTTQVLNREQSELVINPKADIKYIRGYLSDIDVLRSFSWEDIYYTPFLIGFCGQWTLGWKLSLGATNPKNSFADKIEAYCYTQDEADEFIARYEHKRQGVLV